MSERFYLNLPLHPGRTELTGPEAHHLATVCRLRPGDTISLFNGDGREYPAHVDQVGRKSVQLEITGVAEPNRELPFTLEVAAPLPRGDRGQFLIEKLTELGVTSYVPLLCARSVVHPREGKLDKLHRYVIEASKQCGRNVLMRTAEPMTWEAYCRELRPGEIGVLGHPGGQHIAEGTPGTGVKVTVGPEGGLVEAEVELARACGWRLVDLGPRILRIETAALVLASAFGSRS